MLQESRTQGLPFCGQDVIILLLFLTRTTLVLIAVGGGVLSMCDCYTTVALGTSWVWFVRGVTTRLYIGVALELD